MSDAAFQAPSLEFLAEKLPQYQFIGFIAQGGMGAVYKARQISLDREVAIKILPQELGEDEEFRESFTKEARAMAKLNHPNLIGVYDSGDVDGMPYIVMEYVEGSSLHDSCHGKEVEAGQAVTIVKAICDGLSDAHENGIIHRDIKPANIMLNTKAIPKIGDFGLAHPSDSNETGLIMGTPGYTAPEVFKDASQAGALADIYSVGMIFHQLLTGTDPAGTEGPPIEGVGNIRLDAIWRKATQPHPQSRYGSVKEMGMELQKWLDSKTGSLVVGGPVKEGGALSTKKPTAAVNVPGKQTAGVNLPNKMTSPVNVPNPNTAPVSLPAANQGPGFGMLMKVAAIGVLGAAVWFTYGLLQENKDKINQMTGNDHDETVEPSIPGTEGATPVEVVKVDPVTPTPVTPTPVTPTPVTPEPVVPDPDPVAVTPTPVTPEPVTPTPVTPTPVTPTPVTPEPVNPVASNPEPKEDLPPGDPAFRQRAAELILGARKKRDALLMKNANSFQFDLKNHARGADASMAEFLNNFAAACSTGWLPEPSALPSLEAKVAKDYNEAREEQTQILAKHQSEVANIQKFYIPALMKKADEAGDAQLKKQLIAQANRANNINDWVTLLAPEPERVAIAAIKGPVGGGGSFAGRWEVTSDNFTIYNCSADGTFVVEGRGWTGTWEAQSDGTIKVQMQTKAPHFLKRVGDAWEAPNGRNKVIRFVRVGAGSITEMKAGLASGEAHAKDFVGKWDKEGGGVPMRWEVDRDGTVTMYDEHGSKKPWTGVWKALPDGSIWMQLASKKPYEFVKRGNGWITRVNPSMTLTPGKW